MGIVLLSLAAIAPFAGALLLLVLSVVALAYAVGSLLSNEQMKAWARIELVEVFYSAVILAMALFLITMADDSLGLLINSSHPYVSNNVAHGQGFCSHLGTFREYQHLPCHIATAKSFFSTLFGESSFYLYSVISDYNRMAYLASIGVNMETIVHSVGSMSFSPFSAYLSIPISVYNYLFDYGVRSLILIKAQEIMLEFVNGSILPIMLPVGIALRAFPAFRKLGGLIMAIAISMYYVFPAFYIMGSYVLTGMMMEQLSQHGNVDIMKAPLVDFDSMKITDDKSMGDLISNPDVSRGAGGFTMAFGGHTYTEEDLDSGRLIYLNTSDADICTPTQNRQSGFSAIDEWTEFVSLLWKLITFPFSGFMTGETFDEWIMGDNGLVNGMARMIFFSLFFSFLSIMSTIAAIKTISPMLGGDTEIAGLTHLV